MTRRLISRYMLLSTLTFCSLALSAPAHAELTPQELLARGDLALTTSVEPAAGAVPGQRMRLIIEIATPRWFSGGTRITPPEVPGLVVVQTNAFAVNASERRAGSTWVVQRWSLDLFPQREGRFDIPPVRLQISVNAPDGEVSGELNTQALSFNVQLPGALAGLDSWVATPRLRVEQTLDREAQSLTVGDALTRQVSFTADDVLAMMLPAFVPDNLPGLRAYTEPPAVKDRSDRGTMRAMRTEQISYIAEQAGTYVLPAQDFHWWNTETRALSLVSLPAVEVSVSAGAEPTTNRQAVSVRELATYVSTALISGFLIWALWRLLPGIRRASMKFERRLEHAAAVAVKRYRALRTPGLPTRLNPTSADPTSADPAGLKRDSASRGSSAVG
ncbi:MAG: hypothetical protein AAGI11_02725 [Pseudomonadota bacterium]